MNQSSQELSLFTSEVTTYPTQLLKASSSTAGHYIVYLDGIISASLDWTNYMGDRQFGWLGSRPVVDMIVKLDILEEYDFSRNRSQSRNSTLAPRISRTS